MRNLSVNNGSRFILAVLVLLYSIRCKAISIRGEALQGLVIDGDGFPLQAEIDNLFVRCGTSPTLECVTEVAHNQRRALYFDLGDVFELRSFDLDLVYDVEGTCEGPADGAQLQVQMFAADTYSDLLGHKDTFVTISSNLASSGGYYRFVLNSTVLYTKRYISILFEFVDAGTQSCVFIKELGPLGVTTIYRPPYECATVLDNGLVQPAAVICIQNDNYAYMAISSIDSGGQKVMVRTKSDNESQSWSARKDWFRSLNVSLVPGELIAFGLNGDGDVALVTAGRAYGADGTALLLGYTYDEGNVGANEPAPAVSVGTKIDLSHVTALSLVTLGGHPHIFFTASGSVYYRVASNKQGTVWMQTGFLIDLCAGQSVGATGQNPGIKQIGNDAFMFPCWNSVMGTVGIIRSNNAGPPLNPLWTSEPMAPPPTHFEILESGKPGWLALVVVQRSAVVLYTTHDGGENWYQRVPSLMSSVSFVVVGPSFHLSRIDEDSETYALSVDLDGTPQGLPYVIIGRSSTLWFDWTTIAEGFVQTIDATYRLGSGVRMQHAMVSFGASYSLVVLQAQAPPDEMGAPFKLIHTAPINITEVEYPELCYEPPVEETTTTAPLPTTQGTGTVPPDPTPSSGSSTIATSSHSFSNTHTSKHSEISAESTGIDTGNVSTQEKQSDNTALIVAVVGVVVLVCLLCIVIAGVLLHRRRGGKRHTAARGAISLSPRHTAAGGGATSSEIGSTSVNTAPNGSSGHRHKSRRQSRSIARKQSTAGGLSAGAHSGIYGKAPPLFSTMSGTSGSGGGHAQHYDVVSPLVVSQYDVLAVGQSAAPRQYEAATSPLGGSTMELSDGKYTQEAGAIGRAHQYGQFVVQPLADNAYDSPTMPFNAPTNGAYDRVGVSDTMLQK